MSRTKLEVADIFRGQGPAWRQANAGHVSLEQLKVMSAIENCRTAELGGHVVRCENETCGHTEIGYNSCRNRHCPKFQGAAAGGKSSVFWRDRTANRVVSTPTAGSLIWRQRTTVGFATLRRHRQSLFFRLAKMERQLR
jgi:hypothetical protein